MASAKQRKAARRNVKKAQRAWRSMSRRQHSRSQPAGRSRRRPGTGGGGAYYRIEVRPRSEFVTFRTQDVGRSGHTQRLAGKRSSGSWDTKSWLVRKSDAHVERGRLVIDDADAKKALRQIRGPIEHVRGNIFRAKPRKDVAERRKPTPAQRRARKRNIGKAQRARRSRAA